MSRTILVSMLLAAGVFLPQVYANEVSVTNFVNISAAEANNAVFYIKMPSDSIATVSLAGKDKFVSSSGAPGVGIEFEDKIAFIRINDISKVSVGLATECGLGLSIVIEQVDSSVDIKEIQPKVHVTAPDNCQS